MSGFGEGEGELLTLTYPKPLPMRLDRWLVAQRPEQSRSRIQKFIDAGYVRVNGVTGRAKTPLRRGDVVELWMPPPEPLPYLVAQEMALDVLFEDAHLIVLNKPAGLTVHPAPGNKDGTLVNALLHHCPDLPGIGGEMRPGIVHRLDKDTSGLLVVAKNDKAHHGLSEQFAAHGRDGRLERSYLALVWGVPERRTGTIAAAIDRSTANRQKMAVSRGANAREAITHYEVLESFGKPPVASLLRCGLETGRTHQIRVHMAHIGHPLLGDEVYGSGFRTAARKLDPEAREALNQLKRQALHATTLGFEHPLTGQPLRFESPAPDDFATLLTALRLNVTQA